MIFELRQYHIRPGQREKWVKCMEEEIIPFQVKMGMVILGSFVGEEDESVYVWIRRFESEAERKRLYDVVYQSLKHIQLKLAGKQVMVRPWLQYFDDYPWATKYRYDAPQIEAQKKAVTDSKSMGWMLWNPGSLFKRGGIAPKT